MTTGTKWLIPHSSRGDVLYKPGWKFETCFTQAVKEVAAELSLDGRKIAPSTLIATLATQRGEYYTEIRRQINQRMKQLKREQHRHVKTITTTHPTANEKF